MTTAYLASPIDAGSNELIEHARVLAIDTLNAKGVTVFSPNRAWQVGGGPNNRAAHHLWVVNETARKGSDLIVAVISADVSSVGVPAEVALSISERKEVILLLADASAPMNSWVIAAWATHLQQTERGGIHTLASFATWADRRYP